MASDRLDIVIFGASGFSKFGQLDCMFMCKANLKQHFLVLIVTAGKYTIFEGVKLLENLSWGVAGRDEEKLKRTLKEIGDKADKDLSAIPIIIADVQDENSLQKMAERAKVINRCCAHKHQHFNVLKSDDVIGC